METATPKRSATRKVLGSLTVGELGLVFAVCLTLTVLLMPSPRSEYHCTKCGNLIRDERWPGLGREERRCLTSSFPLKPDCKHPAYAPTKSTVITKIGDILDSHSKRLDRGIDVIVAYFRR